MRVSHRGARVLFGDSAIGPGAARALAHMVESKIPRRGGAFRVTIGDRELLIANRRQGCKMASLLRKHAALAEVVRGPVSRGPISGDEDAASRVDEIMGNLAGILDKMRE